MPTAVLRQPQPVGNAAALLRPMMKGWLMRCISIGTVLFLCACPWWAGAATLGTYTFPGPDPGGDTNSPTATNLTFSPFTRLNVVSEAVSDLFRSRSWTTAGVQDTGEYVQFTVQPAIGFTLTLTDIRFDLKRSVDKASPGEKDGPLNVQVQIFEGVSLTLKGTQNYSATGVSQNLLFDFPDFTTLDGEVVTVRLYGWNAGHANGWLDLDSVAVNGSTAPIPEPSTAALLSYGFLLFFATTALRRR